MFRIWNKCASQIALYPSSDLIFFDPVDKYRGYIITENFNERGSEMELLFFGKEEKLKYKGNLVITKNSPMIVRSTMGVLLPRTQINSMLRDVTRRDVTWRNATLFTSCPVVELIGNFWILWVIYHGSYSSWTILFTQKKNTNPKKRRTPFLLKERLWC